MLSFKNVFLICVIILITEFTKGCNTDAIDMENINEVKIYKCKKEVNPEKRRLIYIGELDKNGMSCLAKYVHASHTVKRGYVISEYYLELVNDKNEIIRRIGIVFSEDKIKGLDITTKNPEKTFVTSTHRLIVSSDDNISQALLDEINNTIRRSVKK